ncbi:MULTISPECIES: 3-dehydroquinate synthase [Corynebacterium]|uniref:3-dehydroquinate synthase n=1 Tax=Corynebacterium TaxID=1716 RepID=UPI00124D6270|nr:MULTISPECIES: 3-dehydroquinate synthase [Corynebacterium]
MRSIPVNGASPYEVVIDHGIAPALSELVSSAADVRKVAIIHQHSVEHIAARIGAALSSAGMEVHPLELADAESGKTLAEAGRMWDELGRLEFSRRDVVVSVGGGACTDAAGFIAASWMRGIKVIHCPTTLLAMVDAAVGGKTGINTAAGKNLVGAFHEPFGVFIDLDCLATLPREEIIAGSAEIIKTGFIRDPEILALYESDPAACVDPTGHLPELIARSVAVKAAVVAADLKESNLREILNYGHTFGHAVELNEQFRWRHGNAVAVGMMYVAALSQIRGELSAAEVERHRAIISSVGLPTGYNGASFEQLLAGMRKDKKNRGGSIRFVGLTGVGETTRLEDTTDEQLRQAYEQVVAWTS